MAIFERVDKSLLKHMCHHRQAEHFLTCECFEEQESFSWGLTEGRDSILLDGEGRWVEFYPKTSRGTTGIRATKPCFPGSQYFWEMKMTHAIYGTDVMVGVGTEKTDMNIGHGQYMSLLGNDIESWGFSFKGKKNHGGNSSNYGLPWGQGSLVGIHLDAYKGTLELFVNRESMGIAFTNLPKVPLYPMISSTSSGSGMKLIACHSIATKLEFLSCKTYLEQSISTMIPPGLKKLLLAKYKAIFTIIGLLDKPLPMTPEACRSLQLRD